jgi:hypothetical protein
VSAYLEYILNSPVQLLFIWVAVALLVILLFLRKPRMLVLAATDKGKLQISRHALHRLIEACCVQLKGVATARARVQRGSGKFQTTVRLKVRPDAKLDAIQGYLTQEIGEIYRQNLGIENVGAVQINVVGVVPENEGF